MRKVIYIKALSPIMVGARAVVIPLNHPDTERVTNGHACWTTEVQSIAPNGTTFQTKNSLYQLAAPADIEEADQKIAYEFP